MYFPVFTTCLFRLKKFASNFLSGFLGTYMEHIRYYDISGTYMEDIRYYEN